MKLNATMKTQPCVVTPKDYDPPSNVLDTKVTVLASNAVTQVYEITLQQGDKERIRRGIATTGTSPSMSSRAR